MLNIEWNKVTWYSKLVAVLLFVATFYIGFILGQQKFDIDNSAVNIGNNLDNLSYIYKDNSEGFSIRYAKGFAVDNAYKYRGLGPGKEISGVKFTIPKVASEGTNLSSDTYISVEKIPNATNCTANLFLDQGTESTLTNGDVTYSVRSSTGAGAGNRYEETVYAITGSKPCMAVRYFIHYGVFENYPAGTITEFDKKALINQFDDIRDSLIIER